LTEPALLLLLLLLLELTFPPPGYPLTGNDEPALLKMMLPSELLPVPYLRTPGDFLTWFTGRGGEDKLEYPAVLVLLEYGVWLFEDGMPLACDAGKLSEVSISIIDRGRLNALIWSLRSL